MKTRFFRAITAIAMMLTVSLPSMAYSFEVDGIYYKTISIHYAIVTYKSYSYNDYTGDIVIPEFVTYSGTTFRVSSIGDDAFYRCSGLTSITIPNSVTSIGEYAFSGCSGLTEVTIPNSVTSIGEYAFGGCSGLTEVTIPNSVTSIGEHAFWNCSGLTEVTIPNSVTSIGRYTFYNCDGLTSIEIPNSVTSIGEYAFSDCSALKEITIPNSVTSIGEYAFPSVIYAYYNAKNLTSVGSHYIFSSSYLVVGEDVESIPGVLDSSNAKSIVSRNLNPPVCDAEAFSRVNKSTCTLYVPSASYMDYWEADVWKEFANIKPFVETTSLSLGGKYSVNVKEYIQLTASITPYNASVTDVLWTSSNPTVATVSDTGKVYGVAPGEATITAKTVDGTGITASRKITIKAVTAESITLNQESAVLAPYESIVLTYSISPYNTTDKSVTWSTNNASVATLKVNDDGSATVLMLTDGYAVITATTNDGSNLSASCLVSDSAGIEDVEADVWSVSTEEGTIVVKNAVGVVTVYNLNGAVVASEEAVDAVMRIEGLQQGVYVVTIGGKAVKVVL